uniref:Uncharacterized protein n=1 Tax=Plectus sambesii TaxID=2011161 RepID=A0A914V2Q7_9BILA
MGNEASSAGATSSRRASTDCNHNVKKSFGFQKIQKVQSKNSLTGLDTSSAGTAKQKAIAQRSRSKSVSNQAIISRGDMRRRSSVNPIPALGRLRIQSCFRQSGPEIGELILKRAKMKRSEFRNFASKVGEEKWLELAEKLGDYLHAIIENVDCVEDVNRLSESFGACFYAFTVFGFKPEFFATIADALTTECVLLDGGAHQKCETVLAWSQLAAVMFSSVRDGFYAELRQQRRSSLPLVNRNSNSNSLDLPDSECDESA